MIKSGTKIKLIKEFLFSYFKDGVNKAVNLKSF